MSIVSLKLNTVGETETGSIAFRLVVRRKGDRVSPGRALPKRCANFGEREVEILTSGSSLGLAAGMFYPNDAGATARQSPFYANLFPPRPANRDAPNSE
jgi:hypothetical protein